MTETLSQMEGKVRQTLMDIYPNAYRFTSVYILNSIYEGVKLLFKIRPEARYCGMKLVSLDIPVVTDSNLVQEQAKTLYIDPRWNEAIVYFAIAKCFEIDSSDTANATRANDCFSQFNNLAKL